VGYTPRPRYTRLKRPRYALEMRQMQWIEDNSIDIQFSLVQSLSLSVGETISEVMQRQLV